LDRKQLKIEKWEDNKAGGELYKAKGWGQAVGDFSLPEVNNSLPTWGNYEVKYPDEQGQYDWSKLKDFKQFYLESDLNAFEETYETVIDVDNIIDYFLLINVFSAFDNGGNNVYVCRLNQDSPYFFVSWDYDATLGMGIYGDQEINLIGGLISHGLTRKLIQLPNYRTKLKERWSVLRDNQLEVETILSYYQANYATLTESNVFIREMPIERLGRMDLAPDAMEYLEEALRSQLLFLDQYVESL
ncbi:MAG: CotH kinase family protein, partial [Bacteroidota bacterium]